MKTLLTLILIFASASALAETRYITDELTINMRTGPSNEYRINRNLKNGDKVEELEVDPATGYTRVRTASNVEGWVSSQYITKTPSAQDRLAIAEARIIELEAQNASLKENSSSLSSTQSSLQTDYQKLVEEHKKLALSEKEIRQKAASTLAIDHLNQQLQIVNSTLEREKATLSAENSELKDSTELSWFLRGAAVLFGGVIVGLVLPQIRIKKRSHWDTF